jgi:hypothetical protein
MKKILVPCDFSEPAVEAIKFAGYLARLTHAEINVLHTIELPELYDSSSSLAFEDEFMKDEKEAARRRLAICTET